MKILVIIPCYNEEKNIEKTVNDLIKHNYDYVIINDGSRDNSLEVIRKNNFNYINLSNIFTNNPNYFKKKDNFIPNNKGYERISQIIVENLKNNWYNIPCNFITMT